MGTYASRPIIPKRVYMFWSAIASALRLGWLGWADPAEEMRICRNAIFPLLLNLSAFHGDIKALEAHLQMGADINACDTRGRTPLHLAASQGNVTTVQYLLKNGACVNVKDCDKENPLGSAIRCKNNEIISTLLKEGAHLELSPEEVAAELCCLAHQGDTKQMEIWKQAGASFNYADVDGRTPLHVAVSTNQPDLVMFCIRNGSNLEQRDNHHNRPLDDAERLGLEGLVLRLTAEANRQRTEPNEWD